MLDSLSPNWIIERIKDPETRESIEVKFRVGGLSKQIQDCQYDIIDSLCKEVSKPFMKALEIGSWTGCSSCIIGSRIKIYDGILYCVDNFLGGNEIASLVPVAEKYNIKDIFLSNIKWAELEDTVKLLYMNSREASKQFKNGELDFIFLDGDHSYDGVSLDCNLWFPKLNTGGIIAGHDFSGDVGDGLTRAILERWNSNFQHKNQIWWVKKED